MASLTAVTIICLTLTAAVSITSAHDYAWVNRNHHDQFFVDEQEGTDSDSAQSLCESIGYDDTCCPPDVAANGGCEVGTGSNECSCAASCHGHRDCCSDARCIEEPTTCADIGITAGSPCCNMTDLSLEICVVTFPNGSHCSCNVSCHLHGDCCHDIANIQCLPRNCAEAGLMPGCCSVSSDTPTCYVHGPANCFCDTFCHHYDDCCTDVPPQTCMNSGDKVLNGLAYELKAMRARDHEERIKVQTHTRHDFTKQHQTALNARAQKAYQAARNFRAQANSASVKRPHVH